MVSSKEKIEIESACSKGVSHYLSQKHHEYIKGKMEDGLLGAVIGTLGVVGFSKYYAAQYSFKNIHLLIPAISGLLAGGVLGIWGHNKLDEEHEEDFNEVCDSLEHGE
jgi:hypothetical protein